MGRKTSIYTKGRQWILGKWIKAGNSRDLTRIQIFDSQSSAPSFIQDSGKQFLGPDLAAALIRDLKPEQVALFFFFKHCFYFSAFPTFSTTTTTKTHATFITETNKPIKIGGKMHSSERVGAGRGPWVASRLLWTPALVFWGTLWLIPTGYLAPPYGIWGKQGRRGVPGAPAEAVMCRDRHSSSQICETLRHWKLNVERAVFQGVIPQLFKKAHLWPSKG